ncbi:MAG: type II secretion system F family protein [Chloroflexi bacterium]|nr:type II secretion system F family protein [Chloroflexota bacterium]
MLIDSVIALSSFAAVLFFTLWAVQGVGGPVEARIHALTQQGRGSRSSADSEPVTFQARVVAPLIESVGRRVVAVLPGALLKRMEHRLVVAGQPMSTSAFYSLAVTVGTLFAGLYLLVIVAASDGVPPILALAPSALLWVLGMFLVTFWLSSQARSRRKAMSRGLPDTMDLLTICVEAGLGLDAAFHKVSEKQTGPLVDEIRQMLREIGLGKSRRQGMLDLAERTDLEEVLTFANAVIQAEQLGTSLAQVLRVQSERLRVRRRQAAEQQARKAPVKMVFPLVFCLMPSLFIFILGPIMVNLIGFLSD